MQGRVAIEMALMRMKRFKVTTKASFSLHDAAGSNRHLPK
jgi:hypothetical protein